MAVLTQSRAAAMLAILVAAPATAALPDHSVFCVLKGDAASMPTEFNPSIVFAGRSYPERHMVRIMFLTERKIDAEVALQFRRMKPVEATEENGLTVVSGIDAPRLKNVSVTFSGEFPGLTAEVSGSKAASPVSGDCKKLTIVEG